MISKKMMFCAEKNMKVETLAETVKGKISPVSCTGMLTCEATRFCRFVNPLTTRMPLTDEEPLPVKV